MHKKSFLALLIAVVLTGAMFTRESAAFPEAATAPRAWQLDFTFDKPQAIAITGIDGKVRWYWYIAYKVQNESGRDRYYIPEIALSTDQGDIITAGKDVPITVFAAIKERIGNKLLVSPIKVVGKILLGEDMARESVIVWPAFDHDIDQFTVFVSGLSGETQVITNPKTNEPVSVRRTLMIDYKMPGTGGSPQNQAVVPAGKTWIMR